MIFFSFNMFLTDVWHWDSFEDTGFDIEPEFNMPKKQNNSTNNLMALMIKEQAKISCKKETKTC